MTTTTAGAHPAAYATECTGATPVLLQSLSSKNEASVEERDKCFTSKRDNESVRMVDSSDQEEEGRSGSEGGTLADNRRRRRCIRQPDPSTGEAGDYSFYSLSLSLSLRFLRGGKRGREAAGVSTQEDQMESQQ